MKGFYDKELANIHHFSYGEIARASADCLLRKLMESELKSGHITDLGCGSGIAAEILLEKGFSVTGFDISEAMLRLAKKYSPGGRFLGESIYLAEIPNSVAVLASGEVINYELGGVEDSSSKLELFQKIYNALVPGGFFLFDYADEFRHNGQTARSICSQGKNWLISMRVEKCSNNYTAERKISTFSRFGIGNLFMLSEEIHYLKLLKTCSVMSELRKVGFEVNELVSYGASKLPEGMRVMLARK